VTSLEVPSWYFSGATEKLHANHYLREPVARTRFKPVTSRIQVLTLYDLLDVLNWKELGRICSRQFEDAILVQSKTTIVGSSLICES
jgi:hypothetical protein